MEWLSDEQVLLTLTNKMPYGKYQGRRIIDIPEPYLVWMARSGFPAGKLGSDPGPGLRDQAQWARVHDYSHY